ncbi:hypothetical protein D3C81_2205770 [compost metagenome]
MSLRQCRRHAGDIFKVPEQLRLDTVLGALECGQAEIQALIPHPLLDFQRAGLESTDPDVGMPGHESR